MTDSDRRISDWARTETPVYGSREAALVASDTFLEASGPAAWLTLASARQRTETPWLEEKTGDAARAYGGVMTAWNVTGLLKGATQRPRPHGGPVYDSFPSAHSTGAWANAGFARYYADGLPFGMPARNSVKWTTSALAGATAWARVEGGVHYPTDVLVGAAIASFSTRFFLELAKPGSPGDWRVRTTSDGSGLGIGLEKGL